MSKSTIDIRQACRRDDQLWHGRFREIKYSESLHSIASIDVRPNATEAFISPSVQTDELTELRVRNHLATIRAIDLVKKKGRPVRTAFQWLEL